MKVEMQDVEIWVDGSALKAEEGKFYCGAGVVLEEGYLTNR